MKNTSNREVLKSKSQNVSFFDLTISVRKQSNSFFCKISNIWQYLLVFKQLVQRLIIKGFAGLRFLSHVNRIQGSSTTCKRRLQRALFNHMLTKCGKKTSALSFELVDDIILFLPLLFNFLNSSAIPYPTSTFGR